MRFKQPHTHYNIHMSSSDAIDTTRQCCSNIAQDPMFHGVSSHIRQETATQRNANNGGDCSHHIKKIIGSLEHVATQDKSQQPLHIHLHNPRHILYKIPGSSECAVTNSLTDQNPHPADTQNMTTQEKRESLQYILQGSHMPRTPKLLATSATVQCCLIPTQGTSASHTPSHPIQPTSH